MDEKNYRFVKTSLITEVTKTTRNTIIKHNFTIGSQFLQLQDDSYISELH